jgi:hypothetical protein
MGLRDKGFMALEDYEALKDGGLEPFRQEKVYRYSLVCI